MGLTDDERLAIEQALQKQRPGQPLLPPCSICGQEEWTMNDELGALPTARRDQDTDHLKHQVEALPFVVMLCPQCGNTQFFHLRMLGVGKPF